MGEYFVCKNHDFSIFFEKILKYVFHPWIFIFLRCSNLCWVHIRQPPRGDFSLLLWKTLVDSAFPRTVRGVFSPLLQKRQDFVHVCFVYCWTGRTFKNDRTRDATRRGTAKTFFLRAAASSEVLQAASSCKQRAAASEKSKMAEYFVCKNHDFLKKIMIFWNLGTHPPPVQQ